MRHTIAKGILLIFTSLTCLGYASQNTTPPKNIVLIKNIRMAYKPFSAFETPVFDITNNTLNISVTDWNGNMLQINGIDTKLLSNGVLSPDHFRTVLMWAKDGTYTDDADQNKHSLLEIRCESNQPNSPITIGLKTTIWQNGKKLRTYATLSGYIPSYHNEHTN
jgi:hypothetical protein